MAANHTCSDLKSNLRKKWKSDSGLPEYQYKGFVLSAVRMCRLLPADKLRYFSKFLCIL